MKIRIIIFSIIIVIILFFCGNMKESKNELPLDGLQKIEIVEAPAKSDGSNVFIIPKERIKEFVSILNKIKSYETQESFQEAPNTSIKIYYTDNISYLIEFNRFAHSDSLVGVTKFKYDTVESQSSFFYTDEIINYKNFDN